MTKLADFAGQLVFESEDFIVIGGGKNLNDPGLWYEVCAKNGPGETPEMVFLHGHMARILADKIRVWQRVTPIQEQVEAFLDALTFLGRYPLRTDN